MIKSRLYGSNAPGSGGGGGGGSATTKKTQAFAFVGGETDFTVSNGTLDQIDFVEVNGNVQRPTTDFTVSGQDITFVSALLGAGTVVVHYFEGLSAASSVLRSRGNYNEVTPNDVPDENASAFDFWIAVGTVTLPTVITPAGEEFGDGTMVIARITNPGADPANWKYI